MKSLLDLRREYHAALAKSALRQTAGVPNVADKDSKSSSAIAKAMLRRMGVQCATARLQPQAAGKGFTDCTLDFVRACFALLQHVRPGAWTYTTAPAEARIWNFDQYRHLAELSKLAKDHTVLRAALGSNYLVAPDIVVLRRSLTDEELNRHSQLVGPEEGIARHTPLRAANSPTAVAILHASVSCKLTLRSDRAQNARTEALNLMRSRKGHTPHIAVVTMEPLPMRLASIAIGTGDIDCTYHAALAELQSAVAETKNDDQAGMLSDLIVGRRLRDISDLPLDLAT